MQSAVSSFQAIFSGGQPPGTGTGAGGITGVLGRLEELQDNMSYMKASLTNDEITKFVVVTIPTSLAVAESRRLVRRLD